MVPQTADSYGLGCLWYTQTADCYRLVCFNYHKQPTAIGCNLLFRVPRTADSFGLGCFKSPKQATATGWAVTGCLWYPEQPTATGWAVWTPDSRRLRLAYRQGCNWLFMVPQTADGYELGCSLLFRVPQTVDCYWLGCFRDPKERTATGRTVTRCLWYPRQPTATTSLRAGL